ncbi:MAG: tetratricopeptide repeat protein [Elusimicrobia bacterium]|nr:tetratricopeptide repeat protein [Elusimicrobiota bacterium]
MTGAASLRRPARIRAPLKRFDPFLRLVRSSRVPLMIQGVEHAWDLYCRRVPDPVWFERFLTPQFRAAFAAVDGCEEFAVFSAADVPPSKRSPRWRRLLKSMGHYADFDLPQKTALLRLLGTLGLYGDVEILAAGDPPPGAGAWSDMQCRQRLILERVRFLLREPEMKRRQVLAFRDIAERAPARAPVRLEAAIFFLSRALEQGLPRGDVARGTALAREALASLKDVLAPWEYLRWDSKYWRCISYEPYLRGRPDEARRQLARAEESARDCIRRTPPGEALFGLEDLYGVLTTTVLTEIKLGRPERCRGILQELISMDPEGSWQRLELGRVLAAAGDVEGAMDSLSEAVRLGPPRRAEACRLLAQCCSTLGRRARAEEWRRESERLKKAEEFRGGAR